MDSYLEPTEIDVLDQDELFASSSSNERAPMSMIDSQFDIVVGALEDMLMDPTFTSVHQHFLEQHCDHFDDVEENKFIYTTIFNDYTHLLESQIDAHIRSVCEDFCLSTFMELYQEKKLEQETNRPSPNLDLASPLFKEHEEEKQDTAITQDHDDGPFSGDVFDMLTAMADFQEFKALMVETKRAKHSRLSNQSNSLDGFGICVKPLSRASGAASQQSSSSSSSASASRW